MIVKRIKELGVTSDLAYAASLASIALSIGIWFTQKDKDQPHAERWGIFVGLWAPTLAALGNALKTEEQTERLEKKD
jgi:hypothetical protein